MKTKPLSEEKKLELILRKYHGHTKEQWQNELVKEYPWCEIPYLVEMVWKEAQGVSTRKNNNNKNMKYLVTYNYNEKQKAFYTNWFDAENNFNAEAGMIVFDLINDKYMANSTGWIDIEEDHL